MTRETKIGLLLGMGVILLIGIIISDQLSQVKQDDPADFTGFAAETQRSIDASDASPTGGPGYTPGPGYGTTYTPSGKPSDANTVTDIPGNFFIPEDVRNQPIQRQADATPKQLVADNRPAPAFNVDNASGQTDPPTNDNVQTLVIGGNADPELPHYNVPIESNRQPVRTAQTPAAHQVTNVTTSPTGITHTVRQNETLFKIAQRYYGNGEYWRAIALANPDKVTREGGVYSGSVLDIPKRDEALLNLDIVPAGNETVLRVDTSRGNTPVLGSPRTVEVKPGDTLSELASKHLGSAGRWQELLDANKDQLDAPENLRVGMTLKLPGTAGASQASASTNNTPRSNSRTSTYKVKPGDNLTEIAEKTMGDGDMWRQLYEANRDTLKSPDRLVVGQELRIPS